MITYLQGDATNPVVKPAMIVHICNDVGKWGAGFVLAISEKWKLPEKKYREWLRKPDEDFMLGKVQFVDVGSDICIANMIAQHNVHKKGTPRGIYIRYDALDTALQAVANYPNCRSVPDNFTKDVSIHMPRIGCGLAGGTWEKIEPIIEKNLSEFDVYVYDF